MDVSITSLLTSTLTLKLKPANLATVLTLVPGSLTAPCTRGCAIVTPVLSATNVKSEHADVVHGQPGQSA